MIASTDLGLPQLPQNFATPTVDEIGGEVEEEDDGGKGEDVTSDFDSFVIVVAMMADVGIFVSCISKCGVIDCDCWSVDCATWCLVGLVRLDFLPGVSVNVDVVGDVGDVIAIVFADVDVWLECNIIIFSS